MRFNVVSLPSPSAILAGAISLARGRWVCVAAAVLAWACLFGLVEQLHPGALFIPDGWGAKAATEIESMSPLIYFSFATLTAVGYGDIHATSPLAANLAVSEAIMGQLYLTVLVARLVGLQISHSQRSQS